MERLSYPTETVLPNKITRNKIVLAFKDSPRKSLRPRLFLFQNSVPELRIRDAFRGGELRAEGGPHAEPVGGRQEQRPAQGQDEGRDRQVSEPELRGVRE